MSDDLQDLTKDDLYLEYDWAMRDMLHSKPTEAMIARQAAAEDELARRDLPRVRSSGKGHLYDPERVRDMEGEDAWGLRVAGEEDQDSGEWGA